MRHSSDANRWTGPPLGPLRFTDVPSYFWTVVEEGPQRIALIDADAGTQATYSELARLVDREIERLRGIGFVHGDRLAIVLPNSITWVAMALAAMSLGGILTAASPQLTPAEIERQLAKIAPRVLVMSEQLATMCRDAGTIRRLGCVVLKAEELGGSTAGRLPPSGPPSTASLADEPALMPFSSGTSGLPKPVFLTHRAFSVTANQLMTAFAITPEDAMLGLAPCFHIVGLMTVAVSLVSGARLVIIPRYDPEALLAAIAKHRVSIAIVAPPVLRVFAEHPAAGRYDVSSLRAVTAGGAPVAKALQQRAAERIACPILQGYGMTETSGTISMSWLTDPRPGSCGHLLAGMEARVVDPDSGADCGADQDGEIWVRGPNLMRGYFGEPTATAEAMTPDGWLRTGDLGRFDSDDNLYVCDRLKELIKVHAYQVAPAELEEILWSHPEIADAAVIPRPHARLGEVPVAYVVVRRPVQPQSVMEWLNPQIAPFKRVRAIEFIDAIPRLASGKILRRQLRQIDDERHRHGRSGFNG